ncbi:winged helix-turn-helix domain-containing protein, partial [Planctomycetota bacterium]
SEEVMDFVKKSLEENSLLSTLDLRQLIEEKFGISVHRRSIERVLKHHQKKGYIFLRPNTVRQINSW